MTTTSRFAPHPPFRRPWRGPAALLLFLSLLAGPAAADDAGGPAPERAAPDAGPDSPPGTAAEADAAVPYTVEIAGLAEGEDALRQLLRDSSRLIGLEDEPPATEAGVRRRAEADIERLTQALRSEGFYDGQVAFSIAEPEAADDPLQVTLKVSPGTVYLLSRVRIVYEPAIPEDRVGIPRTAADLDLELGMRARAPTIQAAQRRLLTALENHGYPKPEVRDRQAVIDPSKTTLRVRWTVDPGAFTRFGPVEVSGLETVQPGYVRSFRNWQDGEVFDRRKVDELRRGLMGTGLFRSAAIEVPAPGQDRQAPVRITLTEREHRSIGFGARFSTSTGPSGTAFWEHRNIFGQDEDLRLEAEAGIVEQRLDALLRKPRFRRDNQDLLASLELRHKDAEGFQETAAETALSLERRVGEAWIAGLGGSVEALRIDDNEGRRDFLLFGLPTRLTRDTRDDPLDPTHGTRLAFTATPYLATVDQTLPFMRATVGGSAYWAVDAAERVVLAARGRLGTLVGAETEDVPASKRFYSGGGGSVRGFPFEELGPLDADGDPLGGRSLVEMGIEARIKVTESIGVVPFLDAGQVYDSLYPDLGQDTPLRYGAGLGLRYYTPIGPVRLDVATPLNQRRGVDNDFEIYISLGQAF